MMLTDKEIENIALIAVYTATEIDKRESLPDAELRRILDWATDARINEGLLNGVLNHDMFVRTANGEVTFSLTPKGHAAGAELVAQAHAVASTPGDGV